MGWLTTSNADYIVTSNKSFPFSTYLADGSVMYFDKVVTSKWAGGMTYSTAATAKADYLTAHPRADVNVERQNDAGAYRIVINEETITEWVAE